MSADNDIINNKCVSCGALNITIGATPLCTDCREYYIKYPIPKKNKNWNNHCYCCILIFINIIS